MHDIPDGQSVYSMVDAHQLHTHDLSLAFLRIDSLPIRSFAMQRYIEKHGLDPDNAVLYKLESKMGQELAAIREEILDDFIAYTINSFEFCYVCRPSLGQLTEKERQFFADAHEARSIIYNQINFDPAIAGRFVRIQRIRCNLFVIVPTH